MISTPKLPHLADYHTHTPLCLHATGEPEEFIARAKQLELAEYGISDHAPQTPEPFDDWRMKQADLPAYLEWIDRAKTAAGKDLIVRSGLECDWVPGNQSFLEGLADAHDWDYLIGSVHYLADRWDFDNPKWLGRWGETDVDEVWDQYWETYSEMAATGLFDILAHPDLIKKFGFFPKGDLRRFYDPAIEAIVKSGAAIELNTAGFHKPCAEQYPSRDFLSLAAEANIPITISSDAHAPEEVGRDFPAAELLLGLTGFTHTARFNQRQRSLVPLP